MNEGTLPVGRSLSENDPRTYVHRLTSATVHGGGYATVAESNGEAAIFALEAGTDFRAVVADINLSRKATGWDVARRAREIFPDLPIVYVTSVAAGEWTSLGVPNSILIPKPFASAQIMTIVSQLLVATGQPSSSG